MPFSRSAACSMVCALTLMTSLSGLGRASSSAAPGAGPRQRGRVGRQQFVQGRLGSREAFVVAADTDHGGDLNSVFDQFGGGDRTHRQLDTCDLVELLAGDVQLAQS